MSGSPWAPRTSSIRPPDRHPDPERPCRTPILGGSARSPAAAARLEEGLNGCPFSTGPDKARRLAPHRRGLGRHRAARPVATRTTRPDSRRLEAPPLLEQPGQLAVREQRAGASGKRRVPGAPRSGSAVFRKPRLPGAPSSGSPAFRKPPADSAIRQRAGREGDDASGCGLLFGHSSAVGGRLVGVERGLGWVGVRG